jgi:hypothetical protein
MDFIRSISNNQMPVLDEDYDRLLEEIETEEVQEQPLEEKSALDRVADRVETRNIALYRPIVGTENLMLAKRFLDLAKDGKTVPNSITKGYMPAVEMLDDIVTAGPAYVQLLQALHRRAKRSR